MLNRIIYILKNKKKFSFKPQPLAWTKLKQQGTTTPVPRTGTTLVTIGKNVHIMFGGLEGFHDPKSGKKDHPVTLQILNNVCLNIYLYPK